MAGDKEVEQVTLAIVFTLMSIVAILGNFHIIFTILRLKRMQNVANLILLSLAISDFIVGVVVMPTSIITIIFDRWLTGALMCDISAFIDNISLTMSMWSLGILSIERFFLMTFPFKYHDYMTKKIATAMISTSWIFVAGVCICPMLGFGKYGYTPTYSCGLAPVKGAGHYYFLFFCMAAFAPPLIAGTISYTAILIALRKQWRTKKYLSGNTDSVNVRRESSTMPVEKKENLVACLSVFVCLILLVCFNLPTVIIGLCGWSGIDLQVPKAVYLVFHVTWYLKSAVNPIINGMCNKSFRDELRYYPSCRHVFRSCDSLVNNYTHEISLVLSGRFK